MYLNYRDEKDTDNIGMEHRGPVPESYVKIKPSE